jgi:hypothetical protein
MAEVKGGLSINATTLKMIAAVLMVCDHIHQMFESAGAPIWLAWLGRPVMVMFLFVLSESFHYTRSRKKFLTRLLIGSWLMTLSSALLETFVLPNDNVALMNNAFSTFFVAGLYMWFWDMFLDGVKTRKAGKIIGSILLCLVPVLTSILILGVMNLDISPRWLQRMAMTAIMMLPSLLILEGGPFMVALGVLMYMLRRWRGAQITVLAIFSAILFALSQDPSAQWLMVFAAVPMLVYNGEKGRGVTYFFYIFYPSHIYFLYIVATLWE